eukprot:COSAG01_NODE_6638_length_3567_cov_62.489908_1_plen_333_part_10
MHLDYMYGGCNKLYARRSAATSAAAVQPAMPRMCATTDNTPLLAAVAIPSSGTGERAMQLFAKTTTGKTIPLLHVKGSDDVVRIKALIQEHEGIPIDQQTLYSDHGQLLEDGQTLSGCGIRAESQLQLRLAGEAPPPVGGTSRRRYGAMVAVVVAVFALGMVIGACMGSGGSSTPVSPMSACDGSPCGRHGQCTPRNVGRYRYTCACDYGWDGDTCSRGYVCAHVNCSLWTRSLTGHTSNVLSVAYSPDGATLASGSKDQTIKLWRAADGTLLQTLTGHTDYVLSVAYSPNGATLASGSEDQTIKLWRAADGTLLQTLTGHTNWVWSVAYSPD